QDTAAAGGARWKGVEVQEIVAGGQPQPARGFLIGTEADSVRLPRLGVTGQAAGKPGRRTIGEVTKNPAQTPGLFVRVPAEAERRVVNWVVANVLVNPAARTLAAQECQFFGSRQREWARRE